MVARRYDQGWEPWEARRASLPKRSSWEERSAREVTHVQGLDTEGGISQVQVTPESTAGGNPAFDVTPNRLVTGLITERGICAASEDGLAGLFPEFATQSA